jgi:type VI secretion system protein ImpB
MPSQGQGFIGRNRKPRVHITYEDPHEANRLVELPFVMGVLADLSGNAGKEKADFADREFSEVDMDNFDKYMSSVAPGLKMMVKNKLDPNKSDKMSVNLNFTKMDDFSPGAVAKAVPETEKLLKARDQLKNLMSYMDGKAGAANQMKALLSDPDLMAAIAQKRKASKSDDETE